MHRYWYLSVRCTSHETKLDPNERCFRLTQSRVSTPKPPKMGPKTDSERSAKSARPHTWYLHVFGKLSSPPILDMFHQNMTIPNILIWRGMVKTCQFATDTFD